MPMEPKPSDRTALMGLALLASIIANVLLFSQLFVLRPEYLGQIHEINGRLARIEQKLGIYSPDPSPPARGSALVP